MCHSLQDRVLNTKQFPALNIEDWGLLYYGAALERQKNLVNRILAGEVGDHLVLVEHPAVVTVGAGNGKGDLRVPRIALYKMGVGLYQSDRGGKTTYHGPGQLVVYPIIKLPPNIDSSLYIRKLLTVTIKVIRKYGLESNLRKGRPGLWLDSQKIASIGVAVRRGVAYHGLALNVNNDLTPFDWIVPCGSTGEKFISMQEMLGRPVDMTSLKEDLVHEFRLAFGYIQPKPLKRPSWLKLPSLDINKMSATQKILDKFSLNTVCHNAACPNLGECFSRGTATFMILGEHCTRNCHFCAVKKGKPKRCDIEEPLRVARAVRELGLQYVVVTSVARDDLPDGGANHFVNTIKAIREFCPRVPVEVLVPDFMGIKEALHIVCATEPDVFNHNVETVPRLYGLVRPQADYARSLKVLAYAANHGLQVKSGLMLGLGETNYEIEKTLVDLRFSGCMYLTLGQYLAPSSEHVSMNQYVPPKDFDKWANKAKSMGFRDVAAGPLVRSSYKAEAMHLSNDRTNTALALDSSLQSVKEPSDSEFASLT